VSALPSPSWQPSRHRADKPGLRSLLLSAITGGLVIFINQSYSSSTADRSDIMRAINHIGRTASFLAMLADILLFITFVELARGFLLCLRPAGEPSSAQKFSRGAIFAWAFILFVLSLALLGVGQSYLVQTITRSVSTLRLQALYLTLTRLSTAIAILMWLTSIPILGFAAYVVHKTRSYELLNNVRPTPPHIPHTSSKCWVGG
jgi:hypothetical protein